MGQQAPRSFTPPGEYRGAGGSSNQVAGVQPMQNASAMPLAPSAPIPTVQSPNSTTPNQPAPSNILVSSSGTTKRVGPTTSIQPPSSSTNTLRGI